MVESFVGTFETELVGGRAFRSRFEAELAIVEYIAWFNDVRLHSEIGEVPPSEFEADYLRSPSLI